MVTKGLSRAWLCIILLIIFNSFSVVAASNLLSVSSCQFINYNTQLTCGQSYTYSCTIDPTSVYESLGLTFKSGYLQLKSGTDTRIVTFEQVGTVASGTLEADVVNSNKPWVVDKIHLELSDGENIDASYANGPVVEYDALHGKMIVAFAPWPSAMTVDYQTIPVCQGSDEGCYFTETVESCVGGIQTVKMTPSAGCPEGTETKMTTKDVGDCCKLNIVKRDGRCVVDYAAIPDAFGIRSLFSGSYVDGGFVDANGCFAKTNDASDNVDYILKKAGISVPTTCEENVWQTGGGDVGSSFGRVGIGSDMKPFDSIGVATSQQTSKELGIPVTFEAQRVPWASFVPDVLGFDVNHDGRMEIITDKYAYQLNYSGAYSTVAGWPLQFYGQQAVVGLTKYAESYYAENGEYPYLVSQLFKDGGAIAGISWGIDPDGNPLPNNLMINKVNALNGAVTTVASVSTYFGGNGWQSFLSGPLCDDYIEKCIVVDDIGNIYELGYDNSALRWTPNAVDNEIANYGWGSEYDRYDAGNRRPVMLDMGSSKHVIMLGRSYVNRAALYDFYYSTVTGHLDFELSSIVSIPQLLGNGFDFYHQTSGTGGVVEVGTHDLNVISEPVVIGNGIYLTMKAGTAIFGGTFSYNGPYEYLVKYEVRPGGGLYFVKAVPLLRPSDSSKLDDTLMSKSFSWPANIKCSADGGVVAVAHGWCADADCHIENWAPIGNKVIQYNCYDEDLNLKGQIRDNAVSGQVVQRTIVGYDVDGDGVEEVITPATILKFNSDPPGRVVASEIFSDGKVENKEATLDLLGYGSGSVSVVDMDFDRRPEIFYWGFGVPAGEGYVGDPIYMWRAIDSREQYVIDPPKRECGDGFCSDVERKAPYGTAFYCPSDCGGVCGTDNHKPNGICEPNDHDENFENCPDDCHCGNKICDFGENETSCVQDCNKDNCGNGVCDVAENKDVCPQDCPDTCGDGICQLVPEGEETKENCPKDCDNTCRNGIQDAGEEGVDCGKVCSNQCPLPCVGPDCVTLCKDGKEDINLLSTTCRYVPYLKTFLIYPQVCVKKQEYADGLMFRPFYESTTENSNPIIGDITNTVPVYLGFNGKGGATWLVGVDVIATIGGEILGTGLNRRFESIRGTCYVNVPKEELTPYKPGCTLDPDGEFNYNGNMFDPDVSKWVVPQNYFNIRRLSSAFSPVGNGSTKLIGVTGAIYKDYRSGPVVTDGSGYAKFLIGVTSDTKVAIQHEMSCAQSWVNFDLNVRMLKDAVTNRTGNMRVVIVGKNREGKYVEAASFEVRKADVAEANKGVFVQKDSVIYEPVGPTIDNWDSFWSSFHTVSIRLTLAGTSNAAGKFFVYVDGNTAQGKGRSTDIDFVNTGIVEIAGIQISQEEGNFYIDYVRPTSSDEGLTSDSINLVAERTAKKFLLSCTKRDNNFDPKVSVGIGVSSQVPKKNYRIGDISQYSHVALYCDMLYQAGLMDTSVCDDKWLKEAVRYNSDCFWEANNYCVAFTGATGSLSGDERLKMEGSNSLTDASPCMVMLTSNVAVEKVLSPSINAIIFGLSGATGMKVGYGLVLVIFGLLIVGTLIYIKRTR